MDLSYKIQSQLEDADFNYVLENFKIEKELLDCSFTNYNYSFSSNKSFVFIYLEQVAAFLTLSLNKLCNFSEKNNLADSFQVSLFRDFFIFVKILTI
jgi:hypothetical protein